MRLLGAIKVIAGTGTNLTGLTYQTSLVMFQVVLTSMAK